MGDEKYKKFVCTIGFEVNSSWVVFIRKWTKIGGQIENRLGEGEGFSARSPDSTISLFLLLLLILENLFHRHVSRVFFFSPSSSSQESDLNPFKRERASLSILRHIYFSA